NLIALTEYIVSREAKGAIAFSPIATESKIQFTNPQQASNNSSSSSIQQPLVICVDDSPLICQAMANILLTEGYRFMSIQQPEKVIVTILKQKPNFIFLDLLMPIVNGYELCAQIRRTPKLQAIPIVILTAKDGLVDRMRAKLSGSTDFMSKPVDKKSVIAMLNKYLTVKV
ncbi:MAG: response regulator, partial [Cyanobacteria bacterium J083]